MARDTKQRILEAALEIFARDGYEGTNVKDIADAVGLVKSGIYKHFENKESIWNATIEMVASYYEEHMNERRNVLKIPQNMDELLKLTMGMVNFTIHDRKVIMIRRILTKEQFRDEKIRDLANAHFVYDIEAMFTEIFKGMMEAGVIRECDPEVLAFSYTAPISVLIRMCDREPLKEEEVTGKISKHVELFSETYRLS
ncbi:MAG: TetR/AcrR family transcriptional regulator [Eubacteriales bacterium]|nr:TetR/AcrR family transcriptional regulator [Eubacteriales bacterium]